MSPSNLTKHIYLDALDHFGESDESFSFEDPPPPGSNWPKRIDVFAWKPQIDLNMYSFSTIGMSDVPQGDKKLRTELHFAIRDNSLDINLKRVAVFMANLASYPFMNNLYLDWGHTILSPGIIPYFEKCSSVMFFPAFVKSVWDTTRFDDMEIHYLNIVPLTMNEISHKNKNGPNSLYDYFDENNIDIFQDRQA